MRPLDLVETTLLIDGKPLEFTTLRLEQNFNAHHFFDIGVMCSPLPNKGLWYHEREEVIARMGLSVLIRMKHMDSGDESIFKGIITGIKMESDEGNIGMLHYRGYSPTILLESGKTMDSFTDYSLEDIVKEVVYKYGNGVEAVIKPKFPGTIPYLQMHRESGFEFLRRIAFQYDEWFYYDGRKLYFGNPHLDQEETITHNVELRKVSYSANLCPFNYTRHEYIPEYDCNHCRDDSRRVSGINTYLHEAITASNSLFKSPTTLYNESVHNNPYNLSQLLEMEKGRDIAGMSLLEGKSNTCRIRIAQPVSIKIPKSMCTRSDLGRYRIMSVIHTVDSSGVYANTFKGLPGNMEHLPDPHVVLPEAHPILGKVVNNADPENQGRVQVQFPWQEESRKSTGWIRVLSPNAGKSEAISRNRGFVFIPEVGDQVLVGFIGGNSGRPYVLGSLFRGKGNGQENHHLKSISTDGGHTLEFNDDKNGGGITIRDLNGCAIHIDSKNKDIDITAPETLNLTAKNISIHAEEKVQIAAKQDVNVTAESDLHLAAKGNMEQEVQGNVSVSVEGDLNVESKSDASIKGKKVNLEGENKIALNSKDTQISGKKTTIQSGGHKTEFIG